KCIKLLFNLARDGQEGNQGEEKDDHWRYCQHYIEGYGCRSFGYTRRQYLTEEEFHYVIQRDAPESWQAHLLALVYQIPDRGPGCEGSLYFIDVVIHWPR